MKVHQVPLISILVAWLGAGTATCHAAGIFVPTVSLSQDNLDLIVTLNDPVVFHTNRNVTSGRFGFLMPDAINISGTGGFGISFDPANVPTLTGGTFGPADPSVGLMRGGTTLEILYFLSGGSTTLPAGSEVTLSAGVVRFPNFFNFSVIQGIRNTEIPFVILSETSAMVASEPTAAIPEPSAALLMLGAVGLIPVRRRPRSGCSDVSYTERHHKS